jgi:hypothetical protein
MEELEFNKTDTDTEKEEAELLKAMQQQSEYTPPEPTETNEPTETTETEKQFNKQQQSEDLSELNEAFVSMLDPAVIITMFDGVMVMLSSFIFKAMNVLYLFFNRNQIN